MKILFLITLSELGGAQKYVRDLALAYAREGHHIALAAGPDRNNKTGDWRQGWLFREVTNREPRAANYFLPHLERSTGFFREFQTVYDVIKIIKTECPDIVHLQSTKIGGLGGLAGRLTGVKTVYTVHGLVLNEPLPKIVWLFYWMLEKIAFALCDSIIVISTFDRECILRLGLAPERKLKLIPLTVDPDALNFLPRGEARNQLNRTITEITKTQAIIATEASQSEHSGVISHDALQAYDRVSQLPLVARDDVKYIGTIANFYPTKDLATLIDAARIVVREKPETRFVIIGEGPLRQRLESRIKNQELSERVFLVGSIENASRLLPGLDVFVLSSVKEGLPQVLQEAVAAGVPIVSTNVGGIPELAGHNPHHPWIMIEPRNPRLLAEKILSSLDSLTTRPPKTKEILRREFSVFLKATMDAYALNQPKR